jgi:hypothetical protein
MNSSPSERAKEIEQRAQWIAATLDILRRAHPRNNPSAEDIAALHKLHARHERSHGRDELADVAEERARRAYMRSVYQHSAAEDATHQRRL